MIAAVLGFLALASNVLLAGVSAFLISRAALVTNVAEVALAITAVRVLAISRAGFRYLERLLTHRATFEALTTLRAWFYRSIEPLAPARLAGHRSGDLLARIGADVDTLETFPARVVLPPLVAVAVTILGALVSGRSLRRSASCCWWACCSRRRSSRSRSEGPRGGPATRRSHDERR